MEGLDKQMALASRLMKFHGNTLKEGRANFTTGFLQGRIELLLRYWQEFQDGHNNLSGIPELEESDYARNDVYSSCEIEYSKALGSLYDERARLHPPAQPPDQALSSGGALPHVAGVHLPKIQLPVFSGQWEEWEAFRDVFRSMIHESSSLSDVQKLHYLKTSVDKEAKTAIDGLPITSANYHTAWDILCKRYEHKRLLIHHHMAAIARPPALRNESAAGLQTHLDRIVKSRASLEALGINVSQWDDWFGFFLIQGWDPETKKDWEKSVGNDTELPAWKDLLAFVRGRIRALAPGDSRESTKQGRSSRASLLATSIRQSARCLMCTNDHYLGRCPDFTRRTPQERSQLVERLNCCWNCLSQTHRLRHCPSTRQCQQCGARHHTMLHGARTVEVRRSASRHSPPRKKRRTDETPTSNPSASSSVGEPQ